jgi:hypothetical protein
MLHAYFKPIALCFDYTSWHFYAFSGTNLLTRCHSASFCFLLIFYSRFLPKEIFLELNETKLEIPIYPNTKIESKAETEKSWEAATP